MNKTPAQNAREFINAYQDRHMRMMTKWWGRSSATTHAYWAWRADWIDLCLQQCPEWDKNHDTLGFGHRMAIGHEHAKSTHSVF
jgi:hypothetical protein